VGGFDLTDKSTDFKQLRKNVGMVFQYPEHQLFAETVFEDVAFGLKNFNENLSEQEIYNAVREAIQTVGLPFDEIKNRSPFELSGGQRRRVAIAGVIVTKPKILVLDEPAAGLDPLGKEEVMSLLHRIHGDWCKTVIVVSHDMDEIAENCTSAAVFSQGKILSSGSVSQLFTQTDVLTGAGLDVPFTAKLCKALREENVDVSCNFTVSNLVQNILLACDLQGAGTSLMKEDSQNA
jgi:energy-coupling factor transport system ATP-binding protein